MHTRVVLLALFIALAAVALTGFDVEPAPAPQAERITLSSLATRVALLEEANVDLEARVSELERVVDALAAAETATPEATPTRSDGLRPVRTPTAAAETPSPAPTPTPAATPQSPATPTPVSGDIVIDGITVEWGPLLDMFTVYDVRIETRRLYLETGGSFDAQVLAFEAWANYTFPFAIFQAEMLDADGFAVILPSLVEFNPDYTATGWQRNVRTSGQIMLPTPEQLEKVTTIHIERLNIWDF